MQNNVSVCKIGKCMGLRPAFLIYFLYNANVLYHIFEKNEIPKIKKNSKHALIQYLCDFRVLYVNLLLVYKKIIRIVFFGKNIQFLSNFFTHDKFHSKFDYLPGKVYITYSKSRIGDHSEL